KDRLLQLTKEYDPVKHEQESYQQAQQTIMNTPLQELDYNNIPSLQAQLNPVEYRKKVLGGLKNQQEWNTKNAVDLGNGTRVLLGRKYQSPEAATESVMTDNSYLGKKYKSQYYNQFLNLPDEEKNKIIQDLSKNNVSITKDPKLLKDAATRYMVGKSFEGELLNENVNKIIPDYEYKAMLAANKPENAVNTTVSVSKQGEVDPLFGDRQSVTMDISTPPKGENEPNTYRSDSGFWIDEGNNKIPVSLKGKPLKGSVIQVRSAVDPNNPKKREVYAVVEAKALSNRELRPKYYRELAEKEDEGTITEDEKRILKGADEIPSKLYNVPLINVGKNLQAELKRYNRVDIIGEIEKAHGIKYTDYIIEDKPAAKPSGTAKIILKTDWAKLSPLERKKKIAEGFKVQ
ncbi:MAG TPA: hypothetical protein VFV68_10625, partial [Agriterribacter sp.]|nr:hypothetical protein [Agriterribacter sp.]